MKNISEITRHLLMNIKNIHSVHHNPVLRKVFVSSDIELKEEVQQKIKEIFESYNVEFLIEPINYAQVK